MATGTEMYNAVKQAIINQFEANPDGANFEIHEIDALDLVKLTPPDLEALGYNGENADRISGALFNQDFSLIGASLRVNFVLTHDITRLLPD